MKCYEIGDVIIKSVPIVQAVHENFKGKTVIIALSKGIFKFD